MAIKPKSYQEVVEQNLCRWMGAAIDKHEFCDQKPLKGKPYCQAHNDRAFQKTKRKKES